MISADSLLKRAVLVVGAMLLVTSVVFSAYYYLNFLAPRDSGKSPDVKMEALEKGVIENPKDSNLRVTVAATYLQQGYYDEAITQAEAALKLVPEHQGALLILGEAWLKRGEDQNAASAFQRLVDANRARDTARSDRNLEAAYFNLGDIQARRGQIEEAIVSYRSALEIDATDADARFGLARAHETAGHHDEAVDDFKKAVRFVPDFKEAYEGLLACYQQQGRAEGVAFARGMVAYSSRDYVRAAASLNDAVAQAPRWAEAHLGLGLALEELGRPAEAMTEFQTTLSLDRTNLLAKVSVDRLDKRGQSGATGS